MESGTELEKQDISLIANGLGRFILGGYDQRKDIEDLKNRFQMFEASRLEEASRRDDLADISFKRVCGVAIYLDLGDDSRTVGEELRRQIIECFKEEHFDVIAEDGPHTGSFYWRVFARSKKASKRKDHQKRIENISKHVEKAARSSLMGKLKTGLRCYIFVSTLGLFWSGPVKPEKPAMVDTSALSQSAHLPTKLPNEPRRFDATTLLAALPFLPGREGGEIFKQGAEVIVEGIEIAEGDEKKKK